MNTLKALPVSKQELRDIIENRKSGIILIEGPSACGKTYLLRQLRDTSPRDIRVVSYETVVDSMMANMMQHRYDPKTLAENFSSEVLCIEDVDFLHGKEQTLTELAFLANRLSENNLVIFTGIKLRERIPMLFNFLFDYSYYRYSRSENR
ncbi:MAG: hypothetical protein IJ017_04245 [Oscillospiraceae bacterium]|nr:hypothetical protein [Oscillospiraceae bacterium]